MPKSKYAPLIIAAVIILALILNPSPEKHREKIKDLVGERSLLDRTFRVGQFIAFASTYHSLGVASYTTVNERITSIGFMGLVFVMEK
ncbi:MAG: hypothetical protein ACXU7D_00610 [Burkholderiaceae bacterium]